MDERVAVRTLRLPAANAHLLTGPSGRHVLVDSGTQRSAPLLRRHLEQLGVRPEQLSAVVLTHGHADHAGGAAALLGPALADVPVLIGAADLAMVQAGHNPPLTPTSVSARIYKPFLDRPFTGYTPTVPITGNVDLTTYGVPALVRQAPGHTRGSVVIVVRDTEDPDDGAGRQRTELIAGDLVRGGHLGGARQPGRLLPHYYSDASDRDLQLLATLVDEYHPVRVRVGHGGPLDGPTARERLRTLMYAGSRPARRHHPRPPRRQ